MWDNAPLLRSVANALFGLSLVLVLYGAVRYVLQLPVFPLRAVELTAAPQRVSAELLEKVVREKVSGNFFTVDLEQTRQAFEQLPWVRKVSVRRKFPWSLEVEVEEQVVLARWNGTELVNTHGEVFAGKVEQVLPAFIGQTDSSLQVAQMYAELSAVSQPLQQQIVQLSLSPRYAWQVKLDDGMVIELGREEMQQRLARFVAVYPYSLAAMARAVRHVDLRYRNGFAVYLPGREV
ncbi:MAG: FtsQ-type POTRA domain-containing protein [Nitrosomonadales bacterium]|nr:FtsQ-type POTRA domain-containing protein [Nitrosomonadales bacterium]